MTKKVTVTLVDDLDGRSAADETVGFSLDGVSYEIDLASKNAKKLRGDLTPWVAAGRRIGGRRRPSATGSRTTAGRAAASRPASCCRVPTCSTTSRPTGSTSAASGSGGSSGSTGSGAGCR